MDGQIRHIEGHEAWLQLPVPSDTSAAMRNATVLMQATLYLTLVREIGRLEPRDLTSIRTTPKCKPGYSGPCGPVTEDTALTYATIGEQPLDLDLWYGRLPAPFPVEFPGSFTPLDSQTWPAPGGNNSYSKTLELVMEMPEAYFRLEMPPQRIKFAQPGEFFRPQ
jgi:hypothetical protein